MERKSIAKNVKEVKQILDKGVPHASFKIIDEVINMLLILDASTYLKTQKSIICLLRKEALKIAKKAKK